MHAAHALVLRHLAEAHTALYASERDLLAEREATVRAVIHGEWEAEALRPPGPSY